LSEILLRYPFSKEGLYLRIAETVLATAISLYLLYATTIVSFVLSFTISFPLAYTILTLRDLLKTRKILIELNSRDKCILKRRKEMSYYRFFAKIIVTMVCFLVLPVVINPVIALGIILGAICGHGFSELTHYAYVSRCENRLGGELYYFLSEVKSDGYYYVGIRLLRRLSR